MAAAPMAYILAIGRDMLGLEFGRFQLGIFHARRQFMMTGCPSPSCLNKIKMRHGLHPIADDFIIGHT